MRQLVDEFLRIEDELELPSWTINGYQPWVDLRTRLYERVKVEGLKVVDSAHPGGGKAKPAPVQLEKSDVARYGKPGRVSRKKSKLFQSSKVAIRSSGRTWDDGQDLYFASFNQALGRKVLPVQDIGHPPNGGFKDPRQDLRWINAVALKSLKSRKAKSITLSDSDADRIHEIQNAMQTSFNLELDKLPAQVLTLIRRIPPTSEIFADFLVDHNVQSFLLTASTGRHAYIHGARLAGVKSYELQHGTIGPSHLGYHWPNGKPTYGIPDALLTFGPYWAESTRLANEAIATGAPWVPRGDFSNEKKQDSIVFMSQGPMGKRLFRFATEVAKKLPKHSVTFHLHPSEIVNAYLVDQPDNSLPMNFKLSSGGLDDTYNLLKTSEYNVGVSSTTIFEGMTMGCKTIVVDLLGTGFLDPVIARGDAIKVASVDEFVDRLDSAPLCTDPAYYYAEPISAKGIKELVLA